MRASAYAIGDRGTYDDQSMKKSFLTFAMLGIALIAGLFMLGYGVNSLTSAQALCKGNVMSQGDTCVTSVRTGRAGRETRLRTYDEQRERNRRAGIGFTLGGLLLAASACGLGVIALRT